MGNPIRAPRAEVLPKVPSQFTDFPNHKYFHTPKASHLGTPVSDLGTSLFRNMVLFFIADGCYL